MTFEQEYDREGVKKLLNKETFIPTSDVAKQLGCVQRTAKTILEDMERKGEVESKKESWKGRDGFRWVWKLKESE